MRDACIAVYQHRSCGVINNSPIEVPTSNPPDRSHRLPECDHLHEQLAALMRFSNELQMFLPVRRSTINEVVDDIIQ